MQKNAKNATFFYKECKERCVLLKRMQKNIKNATFFYKERKRTKERRILFKRTLPKAFFVILLAPIAALVGIFHLFKGRHWGT